MRDKVPCILFKMSKGKFILANGFPDLENMCGTTVNRNFAKHEEQFEAFQMEKFCECLPQQSWKNGVLLVHLLNQRGLQNMRSCIPNFYTII